MRNRVFALAVALAGTCLAAPRSAEWEARNKAAKQMQIGEPAPDWLASSETYAIGYDPNDWAALAESKVAFITHCPINRAFFARCRALGIRCFPYVTLYHGRANMTYQGVNLKDHPDFIEVDEAGNLTRSSFWDSEDAKNMYVICPNVKRYQDAMVAWVREIMELGASGVFVDNLHARTPCFGPKFGKHKHVYGDQNQAFAAMLARVREVVKEYQPDGAVLGNSAHPPSLPREFWKYIDADMLESYICTWASTQRWYDWRTYWDKIGQDLQPFLKAGKQIQALSYLGHTPYGVREDAFFCYASARLSGFVWNGGMPLSNPETAALYRLRLGKALGEERQENGIQYRYFERGLVAVNPDKAKAASITIGPPAPTRRLFDVFGRQAMDWVAFPPSGYKVDLTTKRSGERSIMCTNDSEAGAGGATQTIQLNQTKPVPIIVSGWSKAAGVSGPPDSGYSLYVDLTHTDGTPLQGQAAIFSTGTHDWEQKWVVIRPTKPVKSLTVNALFRYKKGTVWFDNISVREEGGRGRARDGGFEREGRHGQIVDTGATGRLEIPKYSGRVYLYAAASKDELASEGPRLIVATAPLLGEVRFRVDGFDYWTRSGRWTTQYEMGKMFGKFDIVFDKPGKHVIEIVDIVPADLKTPAGYRSAERLGEFMDPSSPTRPSAGRMFKFRQWTRLGAARRIEVDVSKDTTVTAEFDVETRNQ